MNAFEEGYAFITKQAGVQIAGYEGGIYVEQIDNEIAKLLHDLNAFEGFKTKPNALKGDIAEFGTQTPLTLTLLPVIQRTELMWIAVMTLLLLM